MSLFSTLSTGASGLGAMGNTLAVIGDNVANINTVGYKSSHIAFADIMPQMIGGLSGLSQVGRGAMVNGVSASFEQGALQNSGSALDVAVMGRGMFCVARGNERFYTRDGSFHIDESNFLVNSQGLRVQGYQAQNGVMTSTFGDMRIDAGPIPPEETTAVTLNANLAADADFSATPYAALVKDGSATAATIADASLAADFSTSITCYDSLGVSHDVTVFFERTASNDWSWSAVVDGGEVDTDGDGVADGTAGSAMEIATGTMTFDTSGNLQSVTGPTATGGAWNFPGADTFDFDLEIGLDAAGGTNTGEIHMTDGQSTTYQISQDGFTTANLIDVRVDADGTVRANYDNGQEQTLGQLALALFPADNGLERMGGNLWRATRNSGQPAFGVAGSGGRGGVAGFALERSNVDLEDEFVQMIQAQRAYQANAGVIRSGNDSLQVLVSLV